MLERPLDQLLERREPSTCRSASAGRTRTGRGAGTASTTTSCSRRSTRGTGRSGSSATPSGAHRHRVHPRRRAPLLLVYRATDARRRRARRSSGVDCARARPARPPPGRGPELRHRRSAPVRASTRRSSSRRTPSASSSIATAAGRRPRVRRLLSTTTTRHAPPAALEAAAGLPLVSRRHAVLGQHRAPRAPRTSCSARPEAYRQWLRKLVLQALCRRGRGAAGLRQRVERVGRGHPPRARRPLRPRVARGHAARPARRPPPVPREPRASSSLPDGAAEHLRWTLPALEPWTPSRGDGAPALPPSAGRPDAHSGEAATRGRLADRPWFDDAALRRCRGALRDVPVERLGYATVRDYVDSFEHVTPLGARARGSQGRAAALDAQGDTRRIATGGRVLEIGAGHPTSRTCSPGSATRSGSSIPTTAPETGRWSSSSFRARIPQVHFVRRGLLAIELSEFPPAVRRRLLDLRPRAPRPGEDRRRGHAAMSDASPPRGVSIHAVDHVHRGNGDDRTSAKLRRLIGIASASADELDAAPGRLPPTPRPTTSPRRATTGGAARRLTTSSRCGSASASRR